MKNLAGVQGCDAQLVGELTLAGISAESFEKTRTEVPYSFIGKMGDIVFKRGWTYWCISGPVPLAIARELHEDPIGRKYVRVAGHCGCPHPDEWVSIRGNPFDDKEIISAKIKELGHKKFMKWARPIEYQYNIDKQQAIDADDLDKLIVDSYHIDTQEALELFANTLRKYGIG